MKLEINGRKVEVDDSFKNLSPEEQNKTVDEIAQSFTRPEPSSETSALIGAPATTAFGFSGKAINPTAVYEQGIKPFVQAGTQTLGKYVQSPIKAGIDVTAMMMGSPVPPVGAMSMYDTMKKTAEAGKTVFNNINQAISYLPKGIDVEAATFLNGLSPEDQGKLLKDINTKGLDKAFKEFKAPQYLDEAGRAALQATQSSFPSTMTKVGRAIAPLARTAARVAGPVGTAMQVNEALPYLEQSQIGQRTRQGEVGQLMRGSRNMMLNQPTPQPLSPDEAQNLLSSGNRRMIDMYGGDEALKMSIRRKAAQKVLGQ
jgi:hypothetical protein